MSSMIRSSLSRRSLLDCASVEDLASELIRRTANVPRVETCESFHRSVLPRRWICKASMTIQSAREIHHLLGFSFVRNDWWIVIRLNGLDIFHTLLFTFVPPVFHSLEEQHSVVVTRSRCRRRSQVSRCLRPPSYCRHSPFYTRRDTFVSSVVHALV